ncbi:MAG: hypothetical protein ACOC0X_06815 [Halobacteriota archaeon]
MKLRLPSRPHERGEEPVVGQAQVETEATNGTSRATLVLLGVVVFAVMVLALRWVLSRGGERTD